MNHFIKLTIALMLMALLALSAASAEPVADILEEDAAQSEETVYAEPLLDSDEALEGYLAGLMGVKQRGMFVPRNLGGDLTGMNRIIYDYIKPVIAEIAAGQRESTIIEVPMSVLGLDQRYTAAELGVEEVLTLGSDNKWAINAEAKAALYAKLDYNLTLLSRAVLWDCPYEMYWYKKTRKDENDQGGVALSRPGVSGSFGATHAEDTIALKGSLSLKFWVSADYSAGEYLVDTEKTQAASIAAENARSVVQRYAGASDYKKLKGYKDTICELTDYNSDMAGQGSENYGNPWQLIWVFDGDDSTTVVCEGYSKAFQYLCDMTDFDDDAIMCYSAIGKLNDVAHMWNIVRMPNGKNYLVDCTNCDVGTAGYPNRLFMVGNAEGSPANGYSYPQLGKEGLSYVYDPKTTRVLFSTQELTLSALDYLNESAIAIDANTFPDAGLRAAVLAQSDKNGDGMLDLDEIDAAATLDASGRAIGSLEGIGLLTSLTDLDCHDNALTALDLDDMPKLNTLVCYANLFRTLDVSDHGTLDALIVSENRAVEGGVKRYQSGDSWLECDLGVRLVTTNDWQYILTLPGALTDIGEAAFEGVDAQTVIVGDGCETIGARAFANCPNLSEVVLPASVVDIADTAFADSPDVFIISESEAVRQWAADHGIGSAAE